MRIYLSPWAAPNARDDAYHPVVADALAAAGWGWGCVDLRVNPDAAPLEGWCLVGSDGLVAASGVHYLGQDDDVLSNNIRNRLENNLGVTLPAGVTLRHAIRQLLVADGEDAPPGQRTKWGRILPNLRAGRYEINLGGRLFDSFAAISGGADYLVDFDGGPESPPAGWTEIQGTAWDQQLNVLAYGQTTAGYIRFDSPADGDDTAAEVDVDFQNNQTFNQAGPQCRMDNVANARGYLAMIERGSAALPAVRANGFKLRYTNTSNARTTIAEKNVTVHQTFNMRLEVNGSSLDATYTPVGGSVDTLPGTSSQWNTGRYGGLYSNFQHTFDNFRFGDLGPAGVQHDRTLSDGLGATDTPARTVAYARAEADPAALADTLASDLTEAVTHERTLADDLAGADTVSGEAFVCDPLLDSGGQPILDSNGEPICAPGPGGVTHEVTITDGLAAADSTGRAGAAARAVTDPSLLLDELARAAASERVAVDAAALADVLDRAAGIVRALADPAGLTDDTAVESAAARAVTDLLGLDDDVTAASAAARQLADPAALADVLDRAAASARAVIDAAVLADTATATLGLARTIVDQLAVTDAAARAVTAAREVVDQLTAADAVLVGAAQAEAATLVDIIAAADQLAATTASARVVVDTLALLDTADAVTAAARTLSDPLSLGDALAAALGHARALTDSAALSDALTALSAAARALTDGLAIADAVTVQQSSAGAATLADLVTIASVLSRVADQARQQADQLATTDDVTAALGVARTIADTVALADALAWQVTTEAAGTITDELALADLLTRAATAARALTDPAGLTDQLDRAAQHARTLADQLALTDIAEGSDTVRLLELVRLPVVLVAWQTSGGPADAWAAGPPMAAWSTSPHLGGAAT